jgi:hypothetical protein
MHPEYYFYVRLFTSCRAHTRQAALELRQEAEEVEQVHCVSFSREYKSSSAPANMGVSVSSNATNGIVEAEGYAAAPAELLRFPAGRMAELHRRRSRSLPALPRGPHSTAHTLTLL